MLYKRFVCLAVWSVGVTPGRIHSRLGSDLASDSSVRPAHEKLQPGGNSFEIPLTSQKGGLDIVFINLRRLAK